MSKSGKMIKALFCLAALSLCFCRCGSESEKSPDNRQRLMTLTSDYTEIVVFSSKVPGYWARQVSDSEEFFLYMQAGSYKKGETMKVGGVFGTTMAAVFRDETLSYEREHVTNIFIVWKAAIYSAAKNQRQPSEKIDRK